MRARSLVVLLVSAFVPLTLLAAPSPAQARTPEQSYQQAVLTATNKARVQHDRAKLRSNACVQKYAARQAQRMANQTRPFHQELGPILDECGLRAVGENIAYGYGTGAAAVRAWMHSDGHRANILNRDYRLLGVGARRSDDGTWYASQVFGRLA